MADQIKALIDSIKKSRNTVFFTGAGVSTDSGIPDFRSPDTGLWKTTSAQELLFIDNFVRKPKEFYNFALKFFEDLLYAEPNLSHRFIAEVQKLSDESYVITQNIDNLHQKAGSHNVIELHGNFYYSYCMECSQEFKTSKVFNMLKKGENPPLCPICKGLIKPDVVFFGESLPHEALNKAVKVSEKAELFIVMGSSLVVNPAALMPGYARSGGAEVAILNRNKTPYDSLADFVIHDNLSNTVKSLEEALYE